MTVARKLAAAAVMSISALNAPASFANEPQNSFYRLDWCDAPDPDRRRDGFHFYCDDPPPDKKEAEPEVPVAKPEPPAPAPEPLVEKERSAVEELAAIRAAVEEAQAEAVLDPTNEEKVARYMRLQGEVVEQSSIFSDTWRRVVWSDPDLDYTRRRPTNSVAGPVFHERRNAAEIAALKEAAKTHGLFFIFEGEETCATCAAQARVLEGVVTQYEIGVLGVSRDGSTLPQFPNPIRDAGQLKALDLADAPVPALVLVEPKTNTVTPIAFAAIAQDQLLERIFVITQSEAGDLY